MASLIDQYISGKPDFARPILQQLREMVLNACPEAVESLKWGMPHFTYKSQIICSMAAFKAYCTFMLWPREGLTDTLGVFITAGNEKAMGQFGKLRTADDLPDEKVISHYVKQQIGLIESGEKYVRKRHSGIPEIPEDLRLALNNNNEIAEKFAKLPASHQREYVQWVIEAKKAETRVKRIKGILEKLGN